MAALTEKLEGELAPLVKEFGCEIVKVSLFEQGKRKILQIMIEENNGNSASIDDCQKVSRAISLKLDVMNLITSRYNLEISSAGIDRPLVKPKDFMRFCNSPVVVKTYEAKFGHKTFKGNLEFASESGIKVKLDVPLDNNDDEVLLLYEEITSAHINGAKR